MIRSALLASLRGVAHAHSERSDGPLGPRGDPGVAANRDRLAAAAGARTLVVPEQVHGADVRDVFPEDAGRGHSDRPAVPRTDGLVTSAPGIALLVQGADCPLVGIADAEAGVVAAVHSGWRGAVARIAAAGVDAAVARGARRDRIVAAVFPGIGPCCFEVGPEVRDAFRAAFDADAGAGSAAGVDAWFQPGAAGGDRLRMDLRAAIVRTLRESGVSADRIDVLPGCTVCDGRFWSHRGSRGGRERHALAIARTG